MELKWTKSCGDDVAGFREEGDEYKDIRTEFEVSVSERDLMIQFIDCDDLISTLFITPAQVKALMPILQRFIDTGTIAPEGT